MVPTLFTRDERLLLLNLADESIVHGLEHGRPLDVDAGRFPATLTELRASFVTLRIAAQLRGCIGSLRAEQTLVEDVAKNAFAAAFRDPRFSPVTAEEVGQLAVSLSILGEPEAVDVACETQLLDLMQSRDAGWMIEFRQKRGLLLPAVWAAIPDPQQFLVQLKRKARLESDFWSKEVVVRRFVAHSFGRADLSE